MVNIRAAPLGVAERIKELGHRVRLARVRRGMSIAELAAKAGVNWARLQKDLAANAAKIDAQIEMNMRLSKAAGISGTPAFVIGDTLADGAFDYANLKGQIADVREAARKGR